MARSFGRRSRHSTRAVVLRVFLRIAMFLTLFAFGSYWLAAPEPKAPETSAPSEPDEGFSESERRALRTIVGGVGSPR